MLLDEISRRSRETAFSDKLSVVLTGLATSTSSTLGIGFELKGAVENFIFSFSA